MSVRRFRDVYFKAVSVLLLLSLILIIDVSPAHAFSVIVNTTSDDEEVDDAYCSLREAITAIASNDGNYYGCTGGDVSSYISVPAGVYTVENQLPWINVPITIGGADAGLTIIQASSCNPITETCSNDHELFWISSAGHLTLSNLTVRHGKNTGDVNGGAIYNAGTLDITNCVLTANRGAQGGVILNNGGTVSVLNSTFSDNQVKISTYWDGGAIFNTTTGTVIIEKSTFSGNYGRFGGAIQNNGTMEITNCTFSGNSATIRGGAIYNFASLSITNCTFSENTSEFGGAGIENDASGILNYTNTIIANSVTGSDCNNEGTINININNLVEDGTCGSFLHYDPSLGPLANNGGPTQTHALLENSTAIDMGNLTFCPSTDQRGVERPQGDGCDLGSYEKAGYLTYLPYILKQ